MEDNKLYPEQPEASVVSDTDGEDSVQDVQPAYPPERQDIDQNETTQPGEPYRSDASQPDEDQRNDVQYRNDGYRNDAQYQNSVSDQNGSYQTNTSYQNGNYQNDTVYQNNNYQSGQSYQDGSYPYNGYQNAPHSGYAGGAYSGTGGQNYDSGYQQYNGVQSYQNTYQNAYQNGYQNTYQNAYQNNGQMELEEPVRISEWVLAMVLMMIPCVNIIMMFVWAFSSTEKKSKSNFFKAYLIFFGISMGVMLLVWIAIVFFAMLSY